MKQGITDTKTRAIILRRTNYGEADRILNILTPEGKLSVIAKGVRREKSKLAGGIELFSVSKVTIHRGRSDLGILTSARLDTFYSRILSDYSTLEFAYEVLKSAGQKSEHIDSGEIFAITEQALAGLNSAGAAPILIAWWWLNLARIATGPPNFFTDTEGDKLSPSEHYLWDPTESALRIMSAGPISANHIKLLRLLISSPLATALKVRDTDPLLPEISPLAKHFSS